MVAGPTYWANTSSGFAQASLGANQQAGVAFQVSTSYTVRSLGYRRSGDGSQYRADSLRLWRTSDGALLGEVDVPSSEAVGGWHFYDLASPATLDTSHTYIVTVYSLSGQSQDYLNGDGPSTVGSPLVKVSAAGRYASTTSYPDSTTTSYAWTADVSDQNSAGAGPGPGATPTDVDTSLAQWLSANSSVNLHQGDGLPWLTKTVADAVKVVTDKLGHGGSGNSLDWIAGLWRLAGDLTDAEIGLLKSLLDRQDQITGASGGGGSAFYGPSGTQVAEGVETLLASGVTPTALGAALALLREQLTLSPDLADTSRWTLVDATSGEGDALVSQQADAYFLSITAYPASQPAHAVAATLWLPRWGWVCPRVHGHFAQRQFHDVMPTIITSEGQFMDGLLIYTPPGFEWTCESYVLDR